jgi:predicted  nucleic acid-binding Zn-ribbon protein
LSGQGNQPSEAVRDRVARQLEEQVRRMIAESVRPLQAEVMALRERVAQREANPSRFEVSLSRIPPELEQQIESRLRKDLGPKVLDEARQQSVHLLESAKAAIDQKTKESHDNFLRRVGEELAVVEKRAHDISAHISQNTREYLQRGLEDYHQKLLEGGNSLKRLSEELMEFLQHNLNAEHEARRGDLEQLRSSVAAESSRLQEHVEYLDTRIAKLDESTRCMESGLDHRLSRMSSEIVKDARSQFQNLANEILEELTARSIKALSDQLDEATENMKVVQNGIVASVSESLKGQATNSLQAVEHSMEHLARLSLERWRLKLEGGLNALAKSLAE